MPKKKVPPPPDGSVLLVLYHPFGLPSTEARVGSIMQFGNAPNKEVIHRVKVSGGLAPPTVVLSLLIANIAVARTPWTSCEPDIWKAHGMLYKLLRRLSFPTPRDSHFRNWRSLSMFKNQMRRLSRQRLECICGKNISQSALRIG